ncbi:hypothetical protein Ancab_005940 [Ancistrocladus abbreviatus]
MGIVGQVILAMVTDLRPKTVETTISKISFREAKVIALASDMGEWDWAIFTSLKVASDVGFRKLFVGCNLASVVAARIIASVTQVCYVGINNA